MLVWSFSIFLAEFKFSGYQHQWSSFSWLVILIGPLSFLLGLYIAYVTFLNTPLLTTGVIREKSKTLDESSLKKLYSTTIILFILYLISFIIEVLVEGYVPIFSRRYDIARIEFGLFGFHLLVNFQLIIMFLNVEYIILTKGHIKEKFLMSCIFFITLLSFALLLQRFNFFFTGIMILVLLYYASKVVKVRNVIVIALIFFGLLYAIQSVRLSQYVSQYIYVTSKMKFSKDYAIFTEPYMYITMNLENMAHAVDKLDNFTLGTYSFDWIYALSGLKHWIANYFHLNAREFLISGYTTYPFHWYYYLDFGLIGVFFFPMLISFFVGIIYYKMKSSAQLKWIILYSICVAIMVISFFTNPLMMLTFVTNFFILWVIHNHFILKQP